MGYRALSCFLLPHVRALCKSQICVAELGGNDRRAPVFGSEPPALQKDESSPWFLLAHRGRLKWMKPSAESTHALLRDWHLQFAKCITSSALIGVCPGNHT